MTIRIAQIKVVSGKLAVEENAALLMDVLAELAPESPDVVVTPECFLDGYASAAGDVTAGDLAERAIDPDSSPHARAVADWAAAHSCWVVLGCTRRDEAGAIYNSALLYDRAGALAGHYDKTHCQDHDTKFTAGRALPVFESDFGPFGVMICADRRWPETVRTLALRGARIVFNPTWGMHGDLNLAMMRTRSFESEIVIAFTHPQRALVTGPGGGVIADCADDEKRFTVTEVNLASVDVLRKSGAYTHLTDRRTDLYEP